jgi:hypothetical protein
VASESERYWGISCRELARTEKTARMNIIEARKTLGKKVNGLYESPFLALYFFYNIYVCINVYIIDIRVDKI